MGLEHMEFKKRMLMQIADMPWCIRCQERRLRTDPMRTFPQTATLTSIVLLAIAPSPGGPGRPPAAPPWTLWPLHELGGKGSSPGRHTLVSGKMPTAYDRPRSVRASQNSVEAPYPASATTGASGISSLRSSSISASAMAPLV